MALTILAMLLAVITAVPLGVLAAWRQGSWVDRLVMGLAVSGFSMPVFWLGFVLVYVFAISLGWLPVQGYVPIKTSFWRAIEHLTLPALTLSLVFMAMTLAVFMAYGLLASMAREKILSRPRVMTWMRRAFAATFAALAVKLALAER